MTKFVTFTDSHIRLTTPTSRTEKDWLSTILTKIEYVFNVAEQNDASAVLCSGDLGDEATWSPKAIVKLQRLLSKYKHIPLVTTIGQHDVYGHKIDEWEYTGLGILATSGHVKVLHAGESLEIDGVTVYGFGFNEEVTLKLLAGEYAPPKTARSIALIHASIGDEDSFGWSSADNLKIKNINICSFGDIHQGFSIRKPKGGTAFCYSTGALVRNSAADIDREVKIGLIEFEDEDGFDFEEITIPCAKGDDAFTKLALSKHRSEFSIEGVSDEFVDLLQSIRNKSDESLKSRILRIGNELGYSKSSIELAIENTEEQK